MEIRIWWQLGLALALGLLVGMEREQSGHGMGIRTFPLITLFGATATLLTRSEGDWMLPAALLAVAAGMLGTRFIPFDVDQKGEDDYGSTTVMAAFVMFTIGGLLIRDYASIAVALAGTTALLLRWKEPMHEFVDRMQPEANRALFRLVLIGLIVLPILPDETYGPYDVLNPFRIWLIVVLIVGISVAGYLVYQFIGARVGLVLGGVLGGIVSSTAATVAYARRSSQSPEASPAAAAAIMIASTLSFVRVVVEVLVVSPEFRWAVLPPFGVMIGLMTLGSVGAYLWVENVEDGEAAQPDEPAALKVAIVFGALYALILFVVAAVEANFGTRGMYVVATLSGLTDVDAITLSTAEMMKADRIPVDKGWRMMLVGALSNMFFKGGAVAVLGHRRLLARTLLLFGGTIVCGLGVVFLWPY
jgi:uncharacterized membrane protein (DUF4010 family)